MNLTCRSAGRAAIENVQRLYLTENSISPNPANRLTPARLQVGRTRFRMVPLYSPTNPVNFEILLSNPTLEHQTRASRATVGA